ncbi:MAG: hypothetical protein JWQ90_501 [Hydrocarboniphaga sp.]|nr:hypothetical protein [Hydrocarboniphaga sp.]
MMNMDEQSLAVSMASIDSPQTQRGATHYPHSRVDSGTLLQNPVDAAADAPKPAKTRLARKRAGPSSRIGK